MKVRTSELNGAALDRAVHYAQCLDVAVIGRDSMIDNLIHDERSPSTNWAQGGPIIEREGIGFRGCGKNWCAFNWGDAESGWQYGPTPLIAAMRCYVASRLGDEVEIPGACHA